MKVILFILNKVSIARIVRSAFLFSELYSTALEIRYQGVVKLRLEKIISPIIGSEPVRLSKFRLNQE